MYNKLNFGLFLILMSGIFGQVKGGEIVLAGTYQGKNLYVQNPFTGNMQDFCTVEVFVNNTKSRTNLNSSAFEIDLSFLQPNEEVFIKIVHKDDCKPKVLNGTVIKSTTNFHFLSFSIDESSLKWTTKSEKLEGKFYVEQFLHNTWVMTSEVQGKGGIVQNDYQAIEHHHSGINKYRVRFREPGGQYFYSKVLEYNSQKQAITFSPKKTDNLLKFSQHTHYEIFDANGISLLKGSGSQVSVASLKAGEYFLNIDNRTEKFIKQ